MNSFQTDLAEDPGKGGGRWICMCGSGSWGSLPLQLEQLCFVGILHYNLIYRKYFSAKKMFEYLHLSLTKRKCLKSYHTR